MILSRENNSAFFHLQRQAQSPALGTVILCHGTAGGQKAALQRQAEDPQRASRRGVSSVPLWG